MLKVPKPPHGSQEWLERRWKDTEGKCTFGASDAPLLANQSPYGNRADLLLAKKTFPTIGAEKESFRRGNMLEPLLLEEASRLLKQEIKTPEFMYQRGRFTISLDGVDNAESPDVVVEAKTTAKYRVKDVTDLPSEWLWQAWAQELVTEAVVFFIVFDADQTFSLVQAPHNPNALEFLANVSERFGQMVDDDGDPDAELLGDMTAEQIGKLWKPEPSAIELPGEAAEWLQLLEQAKSDSAYAKKQEERAKDELARLLLGHEIGLLNGQQVVSWKLTKGRKSLDSKALQQDLPEIYAQYEREGEPFRTMRINRAKK